MYILTNLRLDYSLVFLLFFFCLYLGRPFLFDRPMTKTFCRTLRGSVYDMLRLYTYQGNGVEQTSDE
jgi:hypothetical protein